jgi:hypothetical protein
MAVRPPFLLPAAIACGCAILTGCASEEYRYIPAERTDQSGRHLSEAVYAEPSGAAKGRVRVVSMGVVDVKPSSLAGAKEFPALHLRLAVTNLNDRAEWKVNPRDQFVAFPNQAQVRALPTNAVQGGNAVLNVRPGELRTVDLYFPLPVSQESAKDIPEFDFHWQLQAGNQPVRETTLFDRVAAPPSPVVVYPYDPYPYPLSWGPAWWWGGSVVAR